MSYFDKICRACLDAKEPFKYFLFDNVSPDLYSFCTSVKVYQNENLPKTICDSCYDLLTKIFNFKQTCIKSQNTLLECKNKVKTENDVVTYVNDVDVGIQVNDDHDDFENGFEPETIKIEENVDEFKNDDCDNFNIDIASTEGHLSSCNAKRRKTISFKLQEMAPKLLIVKSVRKIKVSKRLRQSQILSCKLCKKVFSFPERYEAHKLEHEGKTVSICCITCGKKFLTWSGLWRHKERHTDIDPESLKCGKCGKAFKTRYTLRKHLNIHKERKLCICYVCGKKFVSAGTLKSHLEIHEVNGVRKYECDKCGKKFWTNSNLRCHVSKYHRQRKKFVCQLCSFPFTEKYSLMKHMRLHEGLKLFKCDLCDRSYARKVSLVEHKRVHSGERPFTCTYCPKSFATKKRLSEHQRIHTGEKPHKCEVCNQGFTQRGTMKRHMKVHDKLPTTHN